MTDPDIDRAELFNLYEAREGKPPSQALPRSAYFNPESDAMYEKERAEREKARAKRESLRKRK